MSDGVETTAVQVERAETLFAQGRDAEARDTLARLRSAHPSFAECERAAELLTGRRELEEALAWYDLAVTRLSEEDRADRAMLSLAGHVLAARKGIRTLLGHTPDADDLQAPEHPIEGEVAVGTLFWPRAELAHVPDASPDRYFTELEARWRALAARGTSVVLVPGSWKDLKTTAEHTGASVTAPSVRRAHYKKQYAAGLALRWPPPPKAPCWCGSNTEYQTCCGGPRPDRSQCS